MPDPTELIKFHKGTKGTTRAHFQCGDTTVPAILITRLANDLHDQPEKRKEREFTTKLNMPRPGKLSYANFLDALDDANISHIDAFNFMITKLPIIKRRTANSDKIIPTIAKLLRDKRSKISPEDRFDVFAENMKLPEFREGVIFAIKELEAKTNDNTTVAEIVQTVEPKMQPKYTTKPKSQISPKKKK